MRVCIFDCLKGIITFVLFCYSSTTLFGGELIWYYRGNEYLSPSNLQMVKQYPNLNFVPNIKGGNGIPDLHDAILISDRQALRDALVDFSKIRNAPSALLQTIIKEWFQIDGVIDSKELQEGTLNALDGLVFIYKNGYLSPLPVAALLEQSPLSHDRFTRIINAIFELHHSSTNPGADIIPCILKSDEIASCFERMKGGFPLLGGELVYNRLRMFKDIQYLSDGALAYEKTEKASARWINSDDPFFRYLALGMNNSIFMHTGTFSPNSPKSAAVIFGQEDYCELVGSNDDDFVFGGPGNSLIVGCMGNDILVSGNQNSEFRFFKGDGQDIVFTNSVNSNGRNLLSFPDRPFGEVSMSIKAGKVRGSYDLLLTFPGSDDSVLISPFYYILGDIAHIKVESIMYSDMVVNGNIIFDYCKERD